MDETAVWSDMVGNTTVNSKGAKGVALKSTSNEKVRVSVCLTAKADGTKMKPFIVFKGAKRESAAINDEFKSQCVVKSSTNGWMNEELNLTYLRKILGRSEEHTSELQSRQYLVCRLLLEKKKKINTNYSLCNTHLL